MENKVEMGDIVKQGQVIALMGSSGRSTGPHVHFEVYKHGRAVDPSTYIHRASR
jgi:murein DD-endopeptidase MepM/ murein hydrolase activator NlpD